MVSFTLFPKTGIASVIDDVTVDMVSCLTVTDASRRQRRGLLGTSSIVSFTITADSSDGIFTSASDLSSAG